MFQAAKAIICGKDNEPEPKKRRAKEGERDGGMMRFALRFMSHFGKAARALRADFDEQRAAVTLPAQPALAWRGFEADGGDNPLGFFHGDEAYQCEEDFDAGPASCYDAA